MFVYDYRQDKTKQIKYLTKIRYQQLETTRIYNKLAKTLKTTLLNYLINHLVKRHLNERIKLRNGYS